MRTTDLLGCADIAVVALHRQTPLPALNLWSRTLSLQQRHLPRVSGGDGAISVAIVVPDRLKTLKLTAKARILQLLIAALGPLLSAGVEENLHSPRENHCTHVATVGDKGPGLGEMLSDSAAGGFTYQGNARDFAGAVCPLLLQVRMVRETSLPFGITLTSSLLPGIAHQIGGQETSTGFGIGSHRDAGLWGEHLVDGTGIEQVPAQFSASNWHRCPFLPPALGPSIVITGAITGHNVSPAHSAS